jgi:hypothetical protein
LRLLKLIYSTPNLDWLLLTKRPENIKPLLINAVSDQWADPADFTDLIHAWVAGTRIPFNVWIGTSVGVKKTKDRIDVLRSLPAAVRFLSIEPLLEDLGELDLTGIDWVIVGGESGGSARPMHPIWVRSIRDQCVAAGVKFFFKQWGEWAPSQIKCIPGTHTGGGIYLWPNGYKGKQGDFWNGAALPMDKVGKAKAGSILDDREWKESPV